MSATEPGAKHSSNRRRQPLCPIVGWLGRGAIAFAKFGGEDGDMTCVEHRQAVDRGKARPGQHLVDPPDAKPYRRTHGAPTGSGSGSSTSRGPLSGWGTVSGSFSGEGTSTVRRGGLLHPSP